ncbi:hypothetical protein BDN67DRAFT_974582 [Paxillus ammoniavirescens]|nr:hypothetical protein BDN67DRAFT_974582 [Paxillus ammoniavirescens]
MLGLEDFNNGIAIIFICSFTSYLLERLVSFWPADRYRGNPRSCVMWTQEEFQAPPNSQDYSRENCQSFSLNVNANLSGKHRRHRHGLSATIAKPDGRPSCQDSYLWAVRP